MSRAVNHAQRAHRVNLSWLGDLFRHDFVQLQYVRTNFQLAAIFTSSEFNQYNYGRVVNDLTIYIKYISGSDKVSATFAASSRRAGRSIRPRSPAYGHSRWSATAAWATLMRSATAAEISHRTAGGRS
jgi:hypothetical protein